MGIGSSLRRRAVAIVLAGIGLVAPAAASASDRDLLQITTGLLPRASNAALAADGGQGGADAVQAQYDAARDLQDALAAAGPPSSACEPLARLLAGYAQAQIGAAEGVDRLRPAQTARARAAAARRLAGYAPARAACAVHPSAAAAAADPPRIDDPGSFEAFFGAVRARAPAGAVSATVALGGRIVARAAVEDGWLRTRVSAPPARGRLTVTFASATGGVAGRAISEDVWLLPQSAAARSLPVAQDGRLTASLTRAGDAFSGMSAVYTLDLATGTSAASNAEARFPAASTVKLGVLAAALKRFGPRPEERPSFSDLRTLAGWSSNLAANRLFGEIGGSAAAERELRRLGASSSTYPGNYIVGTAFTRGAPPLVSSRVTTARDLGTALATLHRAATGDSRARAASGLSVHQARVALGLLLSSQSAGDNLGMIRRALGPRVPIAQKQGWLDDARLTAAIVYTRAGPRVLVICAYERGLSLGAAQRLGQRVVAALRLP